MKLKASDSFRAEDEVSLLYQIAVNLYRNIPKVQANTQYIKQSSPSQNWIGSVYLHVVVYLDKQAGMKPVFV